MRVDKIIPYVFFAILALPILLFIGTFWKLEYQIFLHSKFIPSTWQNNSDSLPSKKKAAMAASLAEFVVNNNLTYNQLIQLLGPGEFDSEIKTNTHFILWQKDQFLPPVQKVYACFVFDCSGSKTHNKVLQAVYDLEAIDMDSKEFGISFSFDEKSRTLLSIHIITIN